MLKAVLFVVVISSIVIFSVNVINFKEKEGPDRNVLLELWGNNAFNEVYTLSGEQLSKNPLDYFLLTVYGFSAYQLAIAQINNSDMQTLIDSCIWSLRKALLRREGARDGRLLYVLGKAYYYKGPSYGDLTIKYLEKAREIGYEEKDISEYLGLAYISVRDYRKSVEAFTLALNPQDNPVPSDTLLLSIANSYIALEEYDAANAYLIQCLENSRDSKMIFNARIFLGEILFRKGDLAGAEEQYRRVIEESGGNAEAHYRLGILYNSRGETVQARAEWRRAIDIDPSHEPAWTRLAR